MRERGEGRGERGEGRWMRREGRGMRGEGRGKDVVWKEMNNKIGRERKGEEGMGGGMRTGREWERVE